MDHTTDKRDLEHPQTGTFYITVALFPQMSAQGLCGVPREFSEEHDKPVGSGFAAAVGGCVSVMCPQGNQE